MSYFVMLFIQFLFEAADPAWQKYLLEFYRHHGYYPTYEQLHQMWLEQQQTSLLANSLNLTNNANVKNRTRTSLVETSSVCAVLKYITSYVCFL